jgi:hypothetical protein
LAHPFHQELVKEGFISYHISPQLGQSFRLVQNAFLQDPGLPSYREAVAPHSPGLRSYPAFAACPAAVPNPERVPSQQPPHTEVRTPAASPLTQPLQGRDGAARTTLQGSRCAATLGWEAQRRWRKDVRSSWEEVADYSVHFLNKITSHNPRTR